MEVGRRIFQLIAVFLRLCAVQPHSALSATGDERDRLCSSSTLVNAWMMLLGDALAGHQLLRAYSPRCWKLSWFASHRMHAFYPQAPMHSKVPVLEAAIAMNRITVDAATRTTGQISVSGPMPLCQPWCAFNHPSSWWRSHQCAFRKAGAFGFKGCMDDALSFLAPLSAESCLVSARLLVIFGFTTDLGPQCGFGLCQDH